jgi:hypothetical protein
LRDSGSKRQIILIRGGELEIYLHYGIILATDCRDLDGSTMKKVDIFILAGIWTAPDFMEDLCARLTRRYQDDGWSAQGMLLFPYGDWHLGRIRQLREITFDLFPKSSRLGGGKAAAEIKKCYRGGKMVIIGHSGGGVAGVHAAEQLLIDAEISIPPSVVQIGSPKCLIPPALREHVTFVAAVDEYGRWKDPVTRMGGWGAWGRNSRARAGRITPAIREIAITGGHADYFRSNNIETTIDSFWRDIR